MFQVPPNGGSHRRIYTAATLLGFTLSSSDHPNLLKLFEGEAVGRTIVSSNLVENFDRLSITPTPHEIFWRFVEVEPPPNHPKDKHEAAHGVNEVSPSLVLRTGARDGGIGAREIGDQRPRNLRMWMSRLSPTE